MKYDMRVWRKLYALVDQMKKLKPWEHIWSEDYICIEVSKDKYVYCSVMGRNKNCIGMSFYEGDEGYADLCSVSHHYPDMEITKYIMYEQNCLTWYLGDIDEVPKRQKKIMDELGCRYRGHNQWPYFLCFEERHYPSDINDGQAEKLTVLLERLVDVFKEYLAGRIDVDFSREEMIFSHYDKGWIYESMSIPARIDKFMPVELDDKSIYNELRKQKDTNDEIYLDLFFINNRYKDDDLLRPMNPLMFLAIDKRAQKIIYCDLIKKDNDEIGFVLNFFVNYIIQRGLPNIVYFRNPRVYSAVLDICESCGIDMKVDHFSLVNEIIEEIARSL